MKAFLIYINKVLPDSEQMVFGFVPMAFRFPTYLKNFAVV